MKGFTQTTSLERAYDVQLGLGFNQGVPTYCILSVTENGDKVGFNSTVTVGGMVPPNTIESDQFIYSFEGDYITGAWELRIGATGVEDIPNVNEFYMEFYIGGLVYNVELVYNETNKMYQGTNFEAASKMYSIIGEELCLRSGFLPSLMAWYTFEDLLLDGDLNPYYDNLAMNDTQFNGLVSGDYGVSVPFEFDFTLGASLATNLKPNLSKYSLIEVVSGELQDFGNEWLTGDDPRIGSGGDSTNVFTGIDSNSFDLAITSIGTASSTPRIYAVTDFSYEIGKVYIFSFRVAIHSGQAVFAGWETDIYYGQDLGVMSNGIYSLKFTATASNTQARIRFDGRNLMDISVTEMSIKELTPTQREEHRALTHDAEALGSELAANGDFELGDNGDWRFQAAGDMSIVDGVCRATNQVADGSVLQDNIMVEGLTYIVTFEVLNYIEGSFRIRFPFISEDFSGNGVHTFTGVCDNSLDISIQTRGANNTFDIDNISVKEVYQEDLYYIDNVLQAETPALPPPATDIVLDDTAVIGYPDTVDRTKCQFKFYTKVIDATKRTEDYDAYIACSPPQNIVVNGDFEDGTAGWVQMQETAGVGSTDGGAGWQLVPVENGETYQFSCDYDRQGVNPSIAVKQNSENGNSLLAFNPVADGWNNVAGQFVATSNTVAVHLGNGSDTALFDNFSIRKIL